ncbi:MAG TPA: hypothetical protein VF559_08390 [Caulobacteraceae bacterium]|jgi:hypothetical protein
MDVDPALTEAMDEVLFDANLGEDFDRRFRRLMKLTLAGNYDDPDVRRVMECIKLPPETED